jgi:hypothetical protein
VEYRRAERARQYNLSGHSSHPIADHAQKQMIASELLSIVRKESERLEQDGIICRSREVDVSATCGV